MRRGILAFWLALAAFGWSLVLVLAAFVAPVYGGAGSAHAATLVAVNGAWVVAPVAVPAVLSAFVGLALHVKCTRNLRWAGVAAAAGVAVLAVFNLIAIFSIGVFVLPVTLLLIWAATLTGGSRIPCR